MRLILMSIFPAAKDTEGILLLQTTHPRYGNSRVRISFEHVVSTYIAQVKSLKPVLGLSGGLDLVSVVM